MSRKLIYERLLFILLWDNLQRYINLFVGPDDVREVTYLRFGRSETREYL